MVLIRDQEREQKIRSVTLQGALINILLMIFKILTGILVKSSALIADGIHSLSDLATDFVILLGTRFSNRPADESHPYGHRKIETLSSLLVASVLMAVGVGFIWTAGTSISRKEVNFPGIALLLVAGISVVSKEYVFYKTRKIAQKTHSAALYANAWHHRSDSFSSLAVLAGGVAGLIGWGYADSAAAILVGIMVMGVGGKIFYDNLVELTEHAADSNSVKTIEKVLSEEKMLSGFHALRTRSFGGELFLDVHILVDPSLSVLESHDITVDLEKKINEKLSKPANILIHIEPDFQKKE